MQISEEFNILSHDISKKLGVPLRPDKNSLTASLDPELLFLIYTLVAQRGDRISEFISVQVEAEKIALRDYDAAIKGYFQTNPVEFAYLSKLPSRG